MKNTGLKHNGVLHLVLKKKWFELIESGEKKEEYRDITNYWCKRICIYGKANKIDNVCGDCSCELNRCRKIVPTDKVFVQFHCGYTNNSILKKIDYISRGKGKKEWGGTEKEVFIIHLI